jgi:hypothetical protein
MAPRPDDARRVGDPGLNAPPRADTVQGCPPHHWVVASGWQSCKKCDARQEVPDQMDVVTTFWRKGKATRPEDDPSVPSDA